MAGTGVDFLKKSVLFLVTLFNFSMALVAFGEPVTQNPNQNQNRFKVNTQEELSASEIDKNEENLDAVSGADEGEKKQKVNSPAGESRVPDAKRPQKADPQKIKDLDDAFPEDKDKSIDIIKYGLEDEISDFLDTAIKNKDVRFADDIYDLFHKTKSTSLKEKILNYFKTLEDPCLEDFSVTILNDPYDEKLSTVSACFSYIQAVKTKEAIPAVAALIESDSEEYFSGAIETLGKIGGPAEAVYISEFINNEDLSLPQRQSLVKILGELHAVETYDALVEMAQDENENSFIRMYSCEAIGQMEKAEAIPVLLELFSSEDPNLRSYIIKGLSHFSTKEVKELFIEATKDRHQKVRSEAITAIKDQKIKEADSYLIYRAKNDPEGSVKNLAYKALAAVDTEKGNEYLLSQITDKKVTDNVKSRIAAILLAETKFGSKEIAELAAETAKDDRRKQLRYALGKEMAKYKNTDFADVCLLYINSKDVATIGTGLDIYAKGRYSNCDEAVKSLAEKADLYAVTKNQMAIKAGKILGIDLEKQSEEKQKQREAEQKR